MGRRPRQHRKSTIVDTEGIPSLTDKQRKHLMISASAFRPTEGLELVGSQRGYWVRGIDVKTHALYGEWSLEIAGEEVTVKASLKDRKQVWCGTYGDLCREWAHITLGFMQWQKAVNAIELDARTREDPALRHITPSTISDPALYNILGGEEW